MKRITMFGVVAAILFIVTAASAAALTVGPSPLTVGDRSTRASNSKSVTADSKNVFVTGSITITNDGNETVNNLRLGTITPKLGFQVSDLQVNATFSATTLAVNASTTAVITVRIPEKLQAVLSTTYKEAAFNVADYTILATGATSLGTYSSTPTLFAQRKNALDIKEVEVCVNSNCKTVRDNGNIEGLRPGDKVDVKATVENRFSTGDREDLDIQDAELSFEINDRDLDESDRQTLSTIGANSETEESFSFDIKDSVRDGTYKLQIITFGNDELGALHGDTAEIRLKVERDTHNIEIRRATVSPGTFPCSLQSARSGRVTVSMTNVGRRDEPKAAVELVSSELGIKERIENLRMDRDNSRTETIAFTVPDAAKPGTYQLAVKSYFDNTAQSNVVQVPLIIADCSTQPATTTPPASQPPASQPPANNAQNAELLARLAALQSQIEEMKAQPQPPAQPPASAEPVPSTVRKTTSDPVRSTALPWVAGFANSGLYIALLSGVIVLIIIVLIALIIKFLAPRP